MIKLMALHSMSLSPYIIVYGIHPVFAMSCRLRVPLKFVPTLLYNADDVDDGGGGSESDTLLHYRNKSVFVSNVHAIIPAPFKCQMQVKFSGVEFLEAAPMFRKRKKNSSTYAYVLREKARQDISRRSHAVMAKKCSKKCDACAAWFSLSNLLLFFALRQGRQLSCCLGR